MSDGILYVLDALGRSMQALEQQVVAQAEQIAALQAQVSDR